MALDRRLLLVPLLALGFLVGCLLGLLEGFLVGLLDGLLLGLLLGVGVGVLAADAVEAEVIGDAG